MKKYIAVLDQKKILNPFLQHFEVVCYWDKWM